ncbi:MAG: AtpZ/AtpI family protein [Oceanihabitans sp.]
MSKKTNKKAPKNTLNKYAQYSGMAIQMFAIIIIGTYIGIKLDQKFPNKNNLFTVFVSLFAVISSIIFVIRRIISISKHDN